MEEYSYINMEQRKQIEKMYAEGQKVTDIAESINRSVAAVYVELKRGYTGEIDENGRLRYSARLGQNKMQENFRKRGSWLSRKGKMEDEKE